MILFKIRYKKWFLIVLTAMAVLLLLLSAYKGSNYRLGLALIWLLISLNNWYNNAVLELTETEIRIRNGLGIITGRYALNEGKIEVRDKRIFYNEKKIYSHSFSFDEQDFDHVAAYLSNQNPELNLVRHLVDDDDD